MLNPKMLRTLGKALIIVVEQLEKDSKPNPQLSPKLKRIVADSLRLDADHKAGRIKFKKPGMYRYGAIRVLNLD